MDKFYSLCLQGDINSAMKYLNSLDSKTSECRKIEQRFRDRFFSINYEENILTEDNWIGSVILIYHNYFRSVLTNFETLNNAEVKLCKELSLLLRSETSLSIDLIEQKLTDIFKDKGYFFIGGVTPPFRGPYIWRNTVALKFDVEIPLAKQSVTVHMMSDFLLESWIGFATCENKTVGGWANEKGLFCNSKCYPNINADDFQISYLKHEAQHLFDYKQFPNLQSKDLEYRAKLVELIYIKNHSILNKFLIEAKNDTKFPHPFASYLIIKNLSRLIFKRDYESDINLWLEKDYKVISCYALELFEKNSRELKNSI